MAPRPRCRIDTDVAVVGGGPAGAAAAIVLADHGRDVVVVDRAVFPRDKCCGDGLTAAALRHLEHLGLDPAEVPSWQTVTEVAVVGPGGRTVRLPLPADDGQLAASARRVELDAALLGVARRSGASALEGSPVTGVEPVAGGVVVRVDGAPDVRARFVVAADGAWSPVRRSLRLSPDGYRGEWQAGREYVAASAAGASTLWVWFEPDMLPGYAWSFPLADGTVNLGYGVLRPEVHPATPALPPSVPAGPPALRGQRIDLMRRPHIAAALGADRSGDDPGRPDRTDRADGGLWRAWPIPARIGQLPLAALDGRVLFAGDAAGACDPMTGEGIAQALETGMMAAHAIVEAGPGRPGRAATRYRRQVRWGLAVDDNLSRNLSRVLARRTGADGSLALVDSAAWCRRNFARWMFEDYPRAVLVTPHRWSRSGFHRPGAFAGPTEPDVRLGAPAGRPDGPDRGKPGHP